MTQDGSKHAFQVYGMDTSPKAVVIDVSNSTSSLDQKANHTTLPEVSGSNKKTPSKGDNSDGTHKSDNEDATTFDDIDFSLFKKRKKAAKKIPSTSDTYEIKKSFWQMQEDSMHDRIDPIRIMEDTTTTFTGIKASKEYEELEKNHNTSSFSEVHDNFSTDLSYGTTVMIKIQSLTNISSFTPQNLLCHILVNHIKKASTQVKSNQGANVNFNEHFYIDFSLKPSELQIAICKPAEVGIDEHIISAGTIKLPDADRKPEEISLEIDPTGVLTIEIEVLPLECTFPRYNSNTSLLGKAYSAPLTNLVNSSEAEIPEILYKCVLAVEEFWLKENGLYTVRSSEERIMEAKAY